MGVSTDMDTCTGENLIHDIWNTLAYNSSILGILKRSRREV